MCSTINFIVISTACLLANSFSAKGELNVAELPIIIPLILRSPSSLVPSRNGTYGDVTSDYSLFKNDTLLILNRNYNGSIVLCCDAPYPVTWNADSLDHKWVTSKIAERRVTNISDSSTYVYSSLLLLRHYQQFSNIDNSLTNRVGKFECEAIGPESVTPVKSSILIVIERKHALDWISDSKILRSNYYYQNILWDSDLEPILIPCTTTNKNESSVELYSRENRTLRSMTDAEILRVEPFVGYYLNPSAVTASSGEFICVIKNSSNIGPQFVLFNKLNILEDLKPSLATGYVSYGTIPNRMMIFFNVTKNGVSTNANIPLTFEKFQLTDEYRHNLWIFSSLGLIHKLWYRCCTSGEASTRMNFVRTVCNDQMCSARKTLLQSSVIFPDRNISECISIFDSGRFNTTWNPTILTCADKSSGILSSLKEVVGDPKLSLQFIIPKSPELVAGNRLMLSCSANSYYFAKGLYWEIYWSNKSIEAIKGDHFRVSHFYLYENKIRNNFTLDSKMERIGCKAPLWNSTEWVTTTQDIKVQALAAPSKPNSTEVYLVQNISFYAGQPVDLDCEFEGLPKPTYTWKAMPDRTFYPYSAYSSRPIKGFPSARTAFQNVKFTTAGTLSYNSTQFNCTCVASNVLGSATKTFFFRALESKPLVRNGVRTEVVVFYAGRENQNLTCGVSEGAPLPDFAWMKFEANVTNNTETEILSIGNLSHLIFKKIQPTDQGEYHCHMTNFRGAVDKKFVVEVRELGETKLWLEVMVVMTFVTIFGLGLYIFYNNRKNERRIKELQLTVEYNKAINPAQSTATISSLIRR